MINNSSGANYVSTIPIVTLSILIINVIIHVFNFIFSIDLGLLAINAAWVIYRGEYYRIVSSAFTHAGILHILFNMSSLLQLGFDLERQFGSIPFLVLTLWTIFACGVLYVSISW